MKKLGSSSCSCSFFSVLCPVCSCSLFCRRGDLHLHPGVGGSLTSVLMDLQVASTTLLIHPYWLLHSTLLATTILQSLYSFLSLTTCVLRSSGWRPSRSSSPSPGVTSLSTGQCWLYPPFTGALSFALLFCLKVEFQQQKVLQKSEMAVLIFSGGRVEKSSTSPNNFTESAPRPIQSIGCDVSLWFCLCVCAIGCIPWESPNLPPGP